MFYWVLIYTSKPDRRSQQIWPTQIHVCVFKFWADVYHFAQRWSYTFSRDFELYRQHSISENANLKINLYISSSGPCECLIQLPYRCCDTSIKKSSYPIKGNNRSTEGSMGDSDWDWVKRVRLLTICIDRWRAMLVQIHYFRGVLMSHLEDF